MMTTTKVFLELRKIIQYQISLDFKRHSNKVIFYNDIVNFLLKKKNQIPDECFGSIFRCPNKMLLCIQHDHSFTENTAEEGQEERALWMDRCRQSFQGLSAPLFEKSRLPEQV